MENFALKFFPLINSTDGNNIELLRIFVNRAKKKTNYLLFLFKLIQEQTGPTQQVAAILLKDFIKKTWHSEVIFV